MKSTTGFLAERGCYIVDAQQFTEVSTARFFMRVHFVSHPVEHVPLGAEFAALGERYAMARRLREAASRCRTIVMVSKFGHCLNDLMYRWRTAALHADIVAIVSNHADYESLARSLRDPVPSPARNARHQEAARGQAA